MSENLIFKIEDREFSVIDGLRDITSLYIKSSPKPYDLSYNDAGSPHEIINSLMIENHNNLLLIDSNVYELYGRGKFDFSEDRIFIAPATERFKTLNGAVKVIDFLEKKGFTKGDNFIVAGGGIIQDIAAFVCACFKRGIPWTYMPTTLLSMCDSCIGGKAGLNHKNAKNQIALFSAPSHIIINPSFLKTLKLKDLKSGLGEILKLHIIGGKKFIENYEKFVDRGVIKEFSHYRKLIFPSLLVKKAIIEVDEFDLSYRKSLNYGHTIGHALETLSNYKISHGCAIVVGMIIANELSFNRSILSLEARNTLKKLLFALLDINTFKHMKNISLNDLESLIRKDKKTFSDNITFVVSEDIGHTILLKLKINNDFINEISNIIEKNFLKT